MRIDPLVTEEVQDALDDGRPVVALETTLISHGFPGGEGAAVALESEARVRDAGAVPATIGIVDGTLRVGLAESDLKRFADAGNAARKVSARDLAGADLVVKLGPRGVRAGGRVHAAHPARAVDPTGAGDAFAAGYLLGGVTLGLAAAARAVAKMGAMP